MMKSQRTQLADDRAGLETPGGEAADLILMGPCGAASARGVVRKARGQRPRSPRPRPASWRASRQHARTGAGKKPLSMGVPN